MQAREALHRRRHARFFRFRRLGLAALSAALTGDALFCLRKLCGQVCDAEDDYLVIVKENQPQVHRDIATLFATHTPAAARVVMVRLRSS